MIQRFNNRFLPHAQPAAAIPPPPDGASAQLLWGDNAVGSSTSTRYLTPGYDDGFSDTSPTQIRASRAGTIRNMRVRHSLPAGNGNVVVYPLRVNSAATDLSVSLASTVSDGSDLVTSIAVAAGDLLDIQITKAAKVGKTPRNIAASLEFA